MWKIETLLCITSPLVSDTIYTYCSETEVFPGSRVIVPFGRGNHPSIGVVLTCSSAEENEISRCKPVQTVIDPTPVLSPELLKMMVWLREKTFCTYADALRVVLPSGMQMYLTEKITLGSPVPNMMLTFSEQQAYEQLQASPHFSRELEKLPSEIVRSLCEKGALSRETEAKSRMNPAKTVPMIRLCGNAKCTAKQQQLVAVLEKSGALSKKEACKRASVSAAVVKSLVEKGVVEEFSAENSASQDAPETELLEMPTLSAEQQAVYDAVLHHPQKSIFLLHGVTGSGKTCVFLRLIETVLSRGQQAILLVPEIALTPQMMSTFFHYFGNIVAIVHSELTQRQRNQEWQRIARGEVKIIIGTRSAIFSPVQSLGLILIDEEDQHTYQSEQAPRYDTLDVARKRCETHNCPLVLASATPSIPSYYRAKRGIYTLLEMKHRYYDAPLPEVEIVDMGRESILGKERIFSEKLYLALKENLSAGHQSLLLLNRRGYHSVVSCTECREPIYCPNCSIPFTYHINPKRLICHCCGNVQAIPTRCPKCSGTNFQSIGFGTERVETELAELLPEARLLRMDADTTRSRGDYEKYFSAFHAGEYDILLGTQMVGKGLDFPNVTFVGVVSVDKALYAGDFRCYEQTFSLITQVVGRGGRRSTPGKAMLQTYSPDHYILQLAAKQDYLTFYTQEIESRRVLKYPPFCDICVFIFSSEDESLARESAEHTFSFFQQEISNRNFHKPLQIMHPVPCNHEKINRKYRYQIVIKCKDTKEYRDLFRVVLGKIRKEFSKKVSISIDMNGNLS